MFPLLLIGFGFSVAEGVKTIQSAIIYAGDHCGYNSSSLTGFSLSGGCIKGCCCFPTRIHCTEPVAKLPMHVLRFNVDHVESIVIPNCDCQIDGWRMGRGQEFFPVLLAHFFYFSTNHKLSRTFSLQSNKMLMQML
jgi:hypothetical protein